jgi:hypothetical protein
MTPGRRSFVYAIALLLIGGHFLCFMARKDPWPFSSYPMYSRPWTEPWTHVEMVGISRAHPAREVSLGTEGVVGATLRCARTQVGLENLVRRASNDPSLQSRVVRAATQIARLYETQRRRGRASIAPLRGLRVYRQVWRRASDHPGADWAMTERRLVCESHLGGQSGT